MNRTRRGKAPGILWGFMLAAAVVAGIAAPPAAANQSISITADLDTTLYAYRPNNADNPFNSNSRGDFFSAGRTNRKDQIQRGLVHFEVNGEDGVPADAQIISVSLRLRLVGYPQNDANPRRFWLIALTDAQLAEPWGEGTSARWLSEGQHGSGAAAEAGDATWYHTCYNPTTHGAPPSPFVSGGAGYWNQPGALVDGTYASPFPDDEGTLVNSDIYAEEDRNYYEWPTEATEATERMVAEVQAWVNGSATNFGWLLLGNEIITGTNASSKREFASREHADPAWRPTLTVEYAPVPEPAAWLLCLIGLATLGACRVARGRIG